MQNNEVLNLTINLEIRDKEVTHNDRWWFAFNTNCMDPYRTSTYLESSPDQSCLDITERSTSQRNN